MIRRIARPMLASVFIVDGVETLRNPQPHVDNAAPLVDQAAPLVEKGEQVVNENVSANVPPVPKDTETIVKVIAGAKIGAGTLFALGKFPRLSATVLTAAHVPSAVARHSFWLESDPAARSEKTKGLAGDVALLGALILATVDTAGRPGLAWRAGKARGKVAKALPGQSETEQYKEQISGFMHDAGDRARDTADTVRTKAPEYADTVREKAPEVAASVVAAASTFADRVREKAEQAREQAAPYVEQATERAKQAAEDAAPYVDQARERAGEARVKAAAAYEQAAKDAAPYVDQARERAGEARDKASAKLADRKAQAPTKKDAKKAAKQIRKQAKASGKEARSKAKSTAKQAQHHAEAARAEYGANLRGAVIDARAKAAETIAP